MEKAYREHGDVLAEHPVSDTSLESTSQSAQDQEKINEAPSVTV